ncbi:copper-translocating P-type ATPase [Candidatus Woesearchaeota archaeon]|nr:copper-translocating P-type ATPase [Candidatus Woesearchaeota archaeon]
MKKTTVHVLGMHCASCAHLIEKGLKKVRGVKGVHVNYATEKVTIEFYEDETTEIIIKQKIKGLGYDAYGELEKESQKKKDDAKEKEKNFLRNIVILAAVLTVPIIILSFPAFFKIYPQEKMRLYALLILTSPIQFILGWRFYKGAYHALRNKSATMDTLVALGTSAAFFASMLGTFFRGAVYYYTAAVIITLILFGKYIELRVRGKTSQTIEKLMNLQPKTARILVDEKVKEIPVEEIVVGNILIIRPGERIPVDGEVVEGHSFVDESMMTGEPIAKEKDRGEKVFSGTINKNCILKIKAVKVGKETTVAQIIQLVEEAQGSKAPIQGTVDKISSYFVPAVVLIALLTFLFWFFIIKTSIFFALSMFIAVLIIACPCALGLATPTALMIGIEKGAEQGILIKNGEALEAVQSISAIVFDKTGTLTKGKPEVLEVLPVGPLRKDDALRYAAIAERQSEHPIGQAIVKAADKMKMHDATNFEALEGKGVSAEYGGKHILVGKKGLLLGHQINLKVAEADIHRLESEGKTVVLVAVNRQAVAIISIADKIREHAKEAIQKLKQKKIEVYMMTGDNEKTARAVAHELDIDFVLAEVLPYEKAEKIKKLQGEGKKVAMVGDGINDAPALAQADLGISVSSGTDIAMEAGNIVLMKNDMRAVDTALELSKYTLKKIKQNLFWAFVYNTAGIPIAAGILYPVGIVLNPMIAAAAMAASSLSVVVNAGAMRKYNLKEEKTTTKRKV